MIFLDIVGFFDATEGKSTGKFQNFQTTTRKATRSPLNTFRADRGGEFNSTDFINYCKLHGMHRQLTVPYTTQHHGVTERKNRIMFEKAHTMFHEMKVPTALWTEDVTTSLYVLNRSPTSALRNQTPYKALKGKNHS